MPSSPPSGLYRENAKIAKKCNFFGSKLSVLWGKQKSAKFSECWVTCENLQNFCTRKFVKSGLRRVNTWKSGFSTSGKFWENCVFFCIFLSSENLNFCCKVNLVGEYDFHVCNFAFSEFAPVNFFVKFSWKFLQLAILVEGWNFTKMHRILQKCEIVQNRKMHFCKSDTKFLKKNVNFCKKMCAHKNFLWNFVQKFFWQWQKKCARPKIHSPTKMANEKK